MKKTRVLFFLLLAALLLAFPVGCRRKQDGNNPDHPTYRKYAHPSDESYGPYGRDCWKLDEN